MTRLRLLVAVALLALQATATAAEAAPSTPPPPAADEVHDPFEGWNRAVFKFNRGFDRMVNGYGRAVSVAIRRMLLSLVLLAAFAAGAGWLFTTVPSEFVPQEDQGFAFGGVVLPEAAALERTMAATAKLGPMLNAIPGVEQQLMVNGFNAEVTFWRGTLDKLGIVPYSFMLKEYKSAGEPYSRTEMSDAFRESISAVLDDFMAFVLSTIAKKRGLDEQTVQNLVDRGMLTAAEALQADWSTGSGTATRSSSSSSTRGSSMSTARLIRKTTSRR